MNTFQDWFQQREAWAHAVFGIYEGVDQTGTVEHIRKKLRELEKETPGSSAALMEVVDLMFLVCQLATIHGLTLVQLEDLLMGKLRINMAKKWKPHDPSRPNEHDRTESVHEGDTAEPVG